MLKAGHIATLIAISALLSASAHSQSPTVPNISGQWERSWPQAQLFEPPKAGPGPVTGDPAFPHIRGQNSPWIADASNPILKPATRAHLEDLNAQQKAGRALLDNDTLCLPVGVLASLNMFDQTQVLQTPTEVIFLYSRDHQVRTVYLNRAHLPAPAPSWFGDSVGRYEGDTLVVDTIGQNDRTLVDRYGTPHSDQLHTVERYRLLPNGEIEVTVTVDDPVVFTTPWSATAHYKRNAEPFEENVCAENNRVDPDPRLRIPTDETADF